MKRAVVMYTLLVMVLLCGVVRGDEFPVLGYYYPPVATLDQIEMIPLYDSLIRSIGVTAYVSNRDLIPQQLQSAAEHGLRIDINTEFRISDSGMYWPTHYLDYSNAMGEYVGMQILQDLAINGYYFNLKSDVYKLYNDPAIDNRQVTWCEAGDNDAGYLFDDGPSYDDSTKHSVFRHMNNEAATGEIDSHTVLLDSLITARFWIKIPSGYDSNLSVCRVEAWTIWAYQPDSLVEIHIDPIDSMIVKVGDFRGYNVYDSIDFQFKNVFYKRSLGKNDLVLKLYWYGNIDMYVDSICFWNQVGRDFWNLNDTSVVDRIEAKLGQLGANSTNTLAYCLADERGGAVYPIIAESEKLLRLASDNQIGVHANLTSQCVRDLHMEVLCNLADPVFTSMDLYYPLCRMTDTSDITYICPSRRSLNLQDAISSVYDNVSGAKYRAQKYGKDFYNIIAGGKGWGSGENIEDEQGDSIGKLYTSGWEKPSTNNYKMQIYMSLAHGADGIGFWPLVTYGDPPCQGSSVPESVMKDPPMQSSMSQGYPDQSECGKCYWDIDDHGGDPPPFAYQGLLQRDPMTCEYVVMPHGDSVRQILDRAKPLGSILRECELEHVGLIDDGPVGFVDSVIGEFTPQAKNEWIEAATFERADTNYLMLVNRRLLDSESNTATAFLDPTVLPGGDSVYLAVDVSSGEKFTLRQANGFGFTDELLPGEGTLYVISKVLHVTACQPAPFSMNVLPETELTATFNMNVEPASVSDSTFRVYGSVSGYHSGDVTYEDSTNSVRFQPNSPFVIGERVTACLTNEIQTQQELANYLDYGFVWEFSIGTPNGMALFDIDTTFQFDGAACQVCAADFDGDGDVEVCAAVGGYDYSQLAFLDNTGSGRLVVDTVYSITGAARSIVAADFDGDGDIDLATGHLGAPGLLVHLNSGDGTFPSHDSCEFCGNIYSMAPSDFDGDGDIDLVECHDEIAIALLRNDSEGAFTEEMIGLLWDPYEVATNLAAADLNSDGLTDVVVPARYLGMNWSQVHLLLNRGGNGFESSVCCNPPDAYVAVAADFDSDHDADIATANLWHGASALMNAGDGSFVTGWSNDDSTAAVLSLAAPDLDSDGDADLIMGYSTEQIQLAMNDGSGVFELASAITCNAVPRSLCFADLDHDGALDIVVGGLAGEVVVLLAARCVPGNANGYGDPAVDIDDMVYLINYVFGGGPAPIPLLCCGNANGSGDVDIDDIVYLINYIFGGGPAPVPVCE